MPLLDLILRINLYSAKIYSSHISFPSHFSSVDFSITRLVRNGLLSFVIIESFKARSGFFVPIRPGLVFRSMSYSRTFPFSLFHPLERNRCTFRSPSGGCCGSTYRGSWTRPKEADAINKKKITTVNNIVSVVKYHGRSSMDVEQCMAQAINMHPVTILSCAWFLDFTARTSYTSHDRIQCCIRIQC